MSTWLKLLPMEVKEVEGLVLPEAPLGPNDHVVGILDDDMKKLYTLYRSVDKQSDLARLEYVHSSSEDRVSLSSRARELQMKAATLKDIFWIGVQDSFGLWDKEYVGVRVGWQVVWYDLKRGTSFMDLLDHLSR